MDLWPLQNSFEAQHILRHSATTWGHEEGLTALAVYAVHHGMLWQRSTNSESRDVTLRPSKTLALSIFSPESGSKLSVPFPADKPNWLRRSIHSNAINSTSCSHLSEWNISVIFSHWEMGLRWFATLWNRFFWHLQLASFTIRKHWGKDFKGGESQRFDRSLQYQILPSPMLPLVTKYLMLAELSSCNPLRAETGARSLVEKSSHLACTKEQDAFAHGTQQLILRDPNLIVFWHVCKKNQDLCSIGETYHIRLSRYLHLPSFMTVHSI